MITPPI